MTDDTRVLLYSLTHGGYAVSLADCRYTTVPAEALSYPVNTARAAPGVLPQLRLVIADLDGWIQHDGGECPVTGWTPVEVQLDDGEAVVPALPARVYIWQHETQAPTSRITAWRPAQEKRS